MNELSGTVEATRTPRWIRTAGIGAMIGSGAVLLASTLDNLTAYTTTPATAEYVTTWAMFTVGALLLLAGAAAVHTRYGDIYGRLGLAGTAIAALGFISMTVGGAWSLLYTGPAVDSSTAGGFAFVGLLVALIGSLVLAVSLRRIGMATRAVWLLIAAPVVLVATFVVGEAITALTSIDAVWILFLITFCAGWIALGDALRTSSEVTVPEPAVPTA